MDLLTRTLFDLTPAGAMLLRPLYEGPQVTDFAYEQLNLAGQHMLRLPARPTQTFLQLYPMATDSGVFAFYRDAFLAGQPGFYGVDYRQDGLDAAYYQLAAHRAGELLVVTFTDTADRRQGDMVTALQRSYQAEQTALREADAATQRLQALVDQAPVAIGYFEGPELLVTAANPLLSAMWGYPQAAVVGRPLLEGVPELRGQGFEELMQQVRETGQPFVGTEAPATMQRGGQLLTTYYNFVYQPLYDAQGTVLGVMDVAVEVTEQVVARQQVQQLNEELRASNAEYLAANATLAAAQRQLQQLNEELEARVRQRTAQVQQQQALLDQILQNVPAAIATLDGPAHRFSFANPRYQVLVGDRATMGQSVAEALPEVAEQGVIALLDRVYRTGEPFLGSELVIMLEQSPGPAHPHCYDITYLPLRDGHGQVQGILVFAVDVTEPVRLRRQAATLQAELLASARRQAQARQNLYQLFEQTPVAIVLLREPSHTVEYYNPAFAATFAPEGHAADALHGQRLAAVYPRLQQTGLVALLDEVFTTGEPRVMPELPLAGLYPGSRRYATFAYQAYREQGTIVGVAAFIYDATEQVRVRQQVLDLNEELHQSNTRLTRTNADLDAFVYTASHDLRAPIANIEGLVEALQQELADGPGLSPAPQHLLALITQSIARFQTTIGHLSQVMELQQAGSLSSAEGIDLAALVHDVCLDLAPVMAQAQVQVAVEECPTVHFSPKDLRSILFNLLSNALKYRTPERVPLVQVQATSHDHWLELRVQDNGLGLSPAQQTRLFGLFERLHTHVAGSGVGLYAIKKLITNAGGTISVASEVGVGSTFVVRLPLTARS